MFRWKSDPPRQDRPMARISRRKVKVIIAASWMLFVLSFVLPATNINAPSGKLLLGWEAFAESLSGLINPMLWLIDFRVNLFLIFPFANALMLLAPVLCRILGDKAEALAILLVPCAVVPWLIPKVLTGDVFIGFYCWNTSFLTMSLGCLLLPLSISAMPADREARRPFL